MHNDGEHEPDHRCGLSEDPFGTNLVDTGRRKVIAAFGNRMDSPVAHPLLGYSASYRRIMETQARLLSRHLLGEIPSYPAFRTK